MEQSHSVANRDEAVPLLKVTDNDSSASNTQSSRSRSASATIRRAMSPSRLQDKVQGKLAEKFNDVQSGDGPPSGMQDKLFSMLFQQIFPQDTPEPSKPDRRSQKYVQRPDFSLPMMSRNFRRFNSRIGVVFVFQNRLIRLFSWKDPTKTMAFLATLTFCCLDPSLLAVLPLAICVLFVMVPAFIIRHPPPPHQPLAGYEIQGPATALPPNIKPAPEMSKDFFRNMRDLQNCMEDFSVVHDKLIEAIAPRINFSDERLSSTIFLGLFLASCTFFLASGLVPWRFIFLVAGWTVTCSSHPVVVRFFESINKEPIKKQARRARSRILQWMSEDIALDTAPEKREVEIFELQHHSENSWESWMFARSPYTLRSPLRVSGDRPRGSTYFEDVQPPKGWEWSSKKWTLDRSSRDWVEERMISAVEVEVGGESWVYDIADGTSSRDQDDDSSSRTVEWRRRRWVRTVRRKVVKDVQPA